MEKLMEEFFFFEYIFIEIIR